jgi:putative ABC transport system permease protein
MLLAVLTATLASRRPARAVANVPVVAALSGRPAATTAVHRSAVPGAAVLVIALLLLAFSGGWGGNGGKDTLFQLLGLAGVAIGQLLLAPLAISLLGVKAGRAPIAVRIALRDLARYRARSGAALAAASFAVLIAMLVILITTGRYADPVDYFGPNLPGNQVLVSAAVAEPAAGPRVGPTLNGTAPAPHGTAPAPPDPAAQLAQANAIAASLNTSNILALDGTDALLARQTANGSTGGPGTIYVATPAVLAHYGINPNSISPTTMLITSRPGLQGTSGLQLLTLTFGTDPRILPNPTIQTFHQLPTDTSAPNLLVTEHAVSTLQIQVTTNSAWLVQTPHTLTASQINTARQLAASLGMTIDIKSQAPSLTQVRNYATYTGILLALGVLAMTVGLIRSETAQELRTLSATGASSHTRRIITAATAGVLGLLGGVLGTAVAYLATTVFFRTQLSERMSQAPTQDLLLILIGLPVAAAVGGWLFAGREPASIGRQPIE